MCTDQLDTITVYNFRYNIQMKIYSALHIFCIFFFSSACSLAMAPADLQLKLARDRLEDIPTLVQLSHVMAKSVWKEIRTYSTQFGQVLSKHLTSETEVNIVDGCVTEDAGTTLETLEAELEVLQYKKKLSTILDRWRKVLLGQPVYPEIHNLLSDRVSVIHEDFEQFIYRIQSVSVAKFRAGNRELCSKACKNKNKILNLTDSDIPLALELAFANGSNMVPNDVLRVSEVKRYMETDLIQAAVQYSWFENNIYPLYNSSEGLKSVLEQLTSQAPHYITYTHHFAPH